MVQTHTHTHTQFFLNAPFSSDLGRSADTAFISGFSGALNWSHKQTAGVGVYDNINEKLLWGPAGWWSRVKLPGLLHSIIVYLISASLLFGSTPGSPPPPPLMADSATAALNEIKRCKRAGLLFVHSTSAPCQPPLSFFKLWNVSTFARLIILESVYIACFEASFLINVFYVNGLWKIR